MKITPGGTLEQSEHVKYTMICGFL